MPNGANGTGPSQPDAAAAHAGAEASPVSAVLGRFPDRNSRILSRLLSELGWQGEAIQLRNALNGSDSARSLADILATLDTLGYDAQPHPMADSVGTVTGTAPSIRQSVRLFVAQDGQLFLPTDASPLDSDLTTPQGTALTTVLAFRKRPSAARTRSKNWLLKQVVLDRHLFTRLLLASLGINLLALVLPFYIRAVYNIEIAGDSARNLLALFPIPLLATWLQVWIERRRRISLDQASARLQFKASSGVLEKLLRSRLGTVNRVSALSLNRRLQTYDQLSTYIYGPLALSLLDLPYVPIYLLAIASMSIPLMFITVAAIAICFGGILAFAGITQTLFSVSQQASHANYETLLMDAIEQYPTIKKTGQERIWFNRLKLASAQSLADGLPNRRLQARLGALTVQFSQIAGALVLAVGAAVSISSAEPVASTVIPLGSLIAAMFFVWRIFRPIQSLYQAISQWSRMRPVALQLNQFMEAPAEESTPLTTQWVLPMPRQSLEFRSVSLRLNALQGYQLSNLSFKVQRGEILALTGKEDSGRHNLLDLLCGHVDPSSGEILLDSISHRQYPLTQLREAVGLVTRDHHLIPGTVRSNFLVSNPNLSDQAILDLAARLRIPGLTSAADLDQAVDPTRPASFSFATAAGISLARCLLSEPTIAILDHPFNSYTADQVQAALRYLQESKQCRITLISSELPEVLELADTILVMDRGTARFVGTPAELLSARQSTPVTR
ncbi:ATP-binding cassette domain-containing protein [Synechococcus sp. RSCCF101]|uniref:ATP-binding cassette domain-containing protein n=1 Tax=Synechococcus sp. RSCCF101 TaxID=2511069 RepID=UPI001244B932|nr:ATP-binding cassette domain-containing protein [Synechococcus sp. RSCCF101]QEY31538.1 ATP-binding cassette domain-containing protein [Synechococcus sp. RSCCF101]